MRSAVAILILVLPAALQAASSSSLGPSDAMRCFEESRLPLSSSGLKYCDDALRHGDLTRRDQAATYSNRGIILSNNGKLQAALEDHNRAIEIMPALGQAYVNRGNTHYHMRDFEAAIADFDRAIALGATPGQVCRYNKALALLKLGRKDEARASLQAALEFAPDSSKIKNRLEELENL